MGLRVTCNDILTSLLILCFIVYDISSLVSLSSDCAILMMKWLLISHFVILLMKIELTIIDNLDEETNCSLNTMKTIAFIFYIVIYPFLIFWNILGTIWFVQIHQKSSSECRISIEEKSWAILLWLTINYFLTVVYFITTIAIIIEWFGNSYTENSDRNNDMILLENETTLYSDYSLMFLNNKEINKLKSAFTVNKKARLRLALVGQNCSICWDSLENIKRTIIKLPKCDHLFHWNCLREWVRRSPSCPNCRIYLKKALNEYNFNKC